MLFSFSTFLPNKSSICLKVGTPKKSVSKWAPQNSIFSPGVEAYTCVHSGGRGEAGVILRSCRQQSNLRGEILSLNDSMPNTLSVSVFDRNSVVVWNWIFSIQKSLDFNHASLWITLTETQVPGTSPNRPFRIRKTRRPWGLLFSAYFLKAKI